MRAVVGKELRELLVVALPMWIVAGIVAAAEIAGGWDHTEDMVGTAIIGGLALGLAQGLLDQLHRGDAFLEHRPLSADRLQLARTLAGLLVLAIALLAFFASLWVTTWVDAMQLARLRVRVGADFLTLHDPIHYGLATHALVVSLAVGSWALARFVTGLRPYALIVPACLVVPVAAWAVVSRTPTIESALLLSALLAGLFLGLVHVRESGRRGPVSRLLLLGILLLVALEGALWARSGLAEVEQSLLPRFGLAADGRVRLWDSTGKGGEVELDEARNVLERWPNHRDGAPSATLRVRGSLRGEDDTLAYEQLDDPRFLPPSRRPSRGGSWGDPLATYLDFEQYYRSGSEDRDDEALLHWSFADGLFLCRAGTGFQVLAWIGPDGFHEGEPRGDAPRFPSGVVLLRDGSDEELPTYSATALADEETYVIRIAEPGPPWKSTDPVRVEVERKRFAPYTGRLSGPPRVLLEGRRYWLFDKVHGPLAPRPLASDEYVPDRMWISAPSRVGGGLETWLVPQHPTKYGARLRYFGGDGREWVGDARLEPVTTMEKLPEMAMGLLGAIRPPLLNAWAFASQGPRTRGDMNRWWWRDPFFATGSYVGWLLASLALGALMALLAWRAARVRLPTRAAQITWVVAVFLLGPLGLLWMKLAIGRTAVRPVGDGRRAVDLDETPDNRAPWPLPVRSGTEVLS